MDKVDEIGLRDAAGVEWSKKERRESLRDRLQQQVRNFVEGTSTLVLCLYKLCNNFHSFKRAC
jgi:hypothetical protein